MGSSVANYHENYLIPMSFNFSSLFVNPRTGAVLNSDIYSSTGKQNEVSLAIFFYLLIYKANHKLIFLK